MFITKTDITKAIRAEILEQITRGDDTLIDVAINASIGEMAGYLSAYDTDSIFSETGDSRNSLLVQFAVDIAIYNMIDIEQPGLDLEDRRSRYERAKQWLQEVQQGNIQPGFPSAPDIDDETTSTKTVGYGSRQNKRNNYY